MAEIEELIPLEGLLHELLSCDQTDAEKFGSLVSETKMVLLRLGMALEQRIPSYKFNGSWMLVPDDLFVDVCHVLNMMLFGDPNAKGQPLGLINP